MKKNLSIAILACGLLTSCGLGTTGLGTGLGGSQLGGNSAVSQSSGTDVLGAIANSALGGNNGASSLIGNLISTFAGGVTTSKTTLVSTWTYVQPCVQFESENLLTKAGGAVAANKVESQLAGIYQKVGIKPGAFSVTFDKDNACRFVVGGKTYTGTYNFDSAQKTVNISTTVGVQLTSYVSVTGNNMGLTFDSSKLLTLATAFSGQQSSLGTIASLAGNFSGMKMGFEFKK